MSADFDPTLIERAIILARALQERATEMQTPPERRQQAELDRMLQTPGDMATLVQMTDQSFRSRAPARTVDQFTHILDVQGIPRFFSPLDCALLFGFQSFGGWMPGVAVPLVKERMQQETANVVLPAEEELLTAHLRARTEAGVRMNVNFLGEALLGEAEAQRRIERYIDALRLPEIEVVSVKISTLYSQISPLARDTTLRSSKRPSGTTSSHPPPVPGMEAPLAVSPTLTILFCAVNVPVSKAIPITLARVSLEATDRLWTRFRAMIFGPLVVLPA